MELVKWLVEDRGLDVHEWNEVIQKDLIVVCCSTTVNIMYKY